MSESDSRSLDLASGRAERYWRANLKVMGGLLAIWFVVSYGFGIVLAPWLDQFRFFGFKLGFWFAQQGAIYVFLLLIVVYVAAMNRLDARFRREEESAAVGTQAAAQSLPGEGADA